jgi:hypothetical protein
MDGKIYIEIEPLAKTASWLFVFSLSLQKDLFTMITGENLQNQVAEAMVEYKTIVSDSGK